MLLVHVLPEQVFRLLGALQGWIQDFEMGGEFCNNVREIKYYFNI